jgi:hypothetical protein
MKASKPTVITMSPIVSIKPPSAPATIGRKDGGGLRTDQPGDHGPIKPSNPDNVSQNVNPQRPPMPDPQVAPAPSAAVRPVVNPPAPGPASPSPPLVP